MKRPEVVERSQRAVRERRRLLEEGLAPKNTMCGRPGCEQPLKGQATYYCSRECHYADRARLGLRRFQPYHRCFVCGVVFPFDGNGAGKCCSLACAGKLGSTKAEVEIVDVIQLRGFRRADFCDDVLICRGPACARAVVHQHHVVYNQHVVREHGDRWHPGNALGVCVECHGAAHSLRRLPLDCLRDENFAFAANLLGSGRAYEYLRRYYAGSDPRLDALIDLAVAA